LARHVSEPRNALYLLDRTMPVEDRWWLWVNRRLSRDDE